MISPAEQQRRRAAVRAIGCSALIAAIVGVLGGLFLAALEIPTVYRRADSGKCAYVEVYRDSDREEGYSCSNLPDRYEVVTVPEKWIPPGE